MDDEHVMRRMLRSGGAVFAGVLVGVVLSLATDMLLRAMGVLPELGVRAADGALLLATAYRTVYGVAGSYLTAMLAPQRPMLHALVLGFLGLCATVAGTLATWNKGPEYGPHWYPIALIVLALPTAWVGGKLYLLRVAAKAN
ncbi:MAG TPA: hypothetical protein VMV57_03895 [Terracidiphilus sp.]|nr:hypothetical protein [Terracidiphilus sp.]